MACRALVALLIACRAILASAGQEGRSGAAAPRLQPSSVACRDTNTLPVGAGPAFYRPCTFSDLYLWNRTAFFVVEDGDAPPPDLSQLGLRFEVWSKKESASSALGFMRTISADQLRQLLQAAQAAAGGSEAAGGRQEGEGGTHDSYQEWPEEEVIERAYLWKARAVAPSVPGWACHALGSGRTGKSNYYHFTAEWLPSLFMTLCEFFGHCSHADRAGLAFIDVQPRGCNRLENYPPFYAELLSCLSAAPLRHLAGPSLRGRLVRVRHAWAGLGPRCRGIPAGCYEPGSGRLPPTPRLLGAWRGVLGACLGADLQAEAPVEPARLLVVDRLYGSGRHLLNVNSVMRALRAHYPPAQVEVRLAYMEGMSVRQQAALWSRATAVVHMHGAALGNYLFLPRHAAALQLSALPSRPEQDAYNPTTYSSKLERDLSKVSDISVTDWANADPSRVHLNTEAIQAAARRKPALSRFMADRALYGEFSATFRCPKKGLAPDMKAACGTLLLHLNLAIDPSLAVNLTELVLRLAFLKQGRQLRLTAPAGAPSAAPAEEDGDEEDEWEEQGEEAAEGDAAEQQQQRDSARRPGRRRGSLAGGRRGPPWLRRLQAKGGGQLFALGVALGSMAVLGLHGIGRLRRRRLPATLPRRRK